MEQTNRSPYSIYAQLYQSSQYSPNPPQTPAVLETNSPSARSHSHTEGNAPNASTPTGQHALSSHVPESEHFPALV